MQKMPPSSRSNIKMDKLSKLVLEWQEDGILFVTEVFCEFKSWLVQSSVQVQISQSIQSLHP